MELPKKKQELIIYISYDIADKVEAEILQQAITHKCLQVECLSRHQTNAFQNTQNARNSDVYILLLSTNCLNNDGWIKAPLWTEYIDAINFKSKIARIYIFLQETGKFPEKLLEKFNHRPPYSFRMVSGRDYKKNSLEEILFILKETGVPVISEEKSFDPSMEAPGYNVFISYKSEDFRYAEIVYNLLISSGIKAFLSKASLPQLGSDEYREQIDLAIDQARHMVVVTSSHEYVMSEWVKYEWGLFLGEKLAGRKQGNLITITAEDLPISALPISLRNREVIPLEGDGIGPLLEYLKKD